MKCKLQMVMDTGMLLMNSEAALKMNASRRTGQAIDLHVPKAGEDMWLVMVPCRTKTTHGKQDTSTASESEICC